MNTSPIDTQTAGTSDGSGPSPLDIAELVLNALREQDRRIGEIEQTICADPETAEPTADAPGFMTAREYASVQGLRLSVTETFELDRRAEDFCRELRLQTGRAWDDLFGEVNTYHFEALDEVCSEWLQTGGAQ